MGSSHPFPLPSGYAVAGAQLPMGWQGPERKESGLSLAEKLQAVGRQTQSWGQGNARRSRVEAGAIGQGICAMAARARVAMPGVDGRRWAEVGACEGCWQVSEGAVCAAVQGRGAHGEAG